MTATNDAETIARLTLEIEEARWERACQQGIAAQQRARAETAEAEVARLTLRVRDLSSGIVIRGWWCLLCVSFNGEEHSERTECRSCGRAKTVRQ